MSISVLFPLRDDPDCLSRQAGSDQRKNRWISINLIVNSLLSGSFLIKFSSLSAPTKIEELTAGSDEKTQRSPAGNRIQGLVKSIRTLYTRGEFSFFSQLQCERTRALLGHGCRQVRSPDISPLQCQKAKINYFFTRILSAKFCRCANGRFWR